MKKVVVIDYEVGNLYSVVRAFEKVGAEVKLSKDHKEILAADRLVLPGVGAFQSGFEALQKNSLDQTIKEYVRTQRPLLGICLGMQMLATTSDENGTHQGLNIIEGNVKHIRDQIFNKETFDFRAPRIGWYELNEAEQRWSDSILSSVKEEQSPSFYFVHSYSLVPKSTKDVLAWSHEHTTPLVAAVCKDQIFGCQFHPEKSGQAGLNILSNFIRKT